MFSLRSRSLVCSAVWYVLATLTFVTWTASAFGQVATSTTVSVAPTLVYFGQTPIATVTVTATDGSTPGGSVECNIQARGHNAAYGRALQNGVASIPLSSVAEDPVGKQYALACSYPGSPDYAASFATAVPFQIIDCSVWTVNGNGTVSELNCTGAVLGTLGTPGASATAGGIAVDSTGNAWAVTNTANSLVLVTQGPVPGSGVNPGPGSASTFTGGGLLQPTSVAIDGAGQVWIANGGNSVSSFSSNGAAQSPASGYGATTAAAPTPYNAPSSIAVDQAGSVWITNSGSNNVTRIFGSAAPVAPLVTSVDTDTSGTKP
jgi:streptogramin lyase